jgi:hypothetical protein
MISLLGGALIVAGCRADINHHPRTFGPVVRELAPIVLADTGEGLVGRAGDLAAGPDGEIVVLDDQSRSALVFDNRGRFRARLSRAGGGPDELLSSGAVGVSERWVFISDLQRGRVLVYDRDSLSFAGALPVATAIRSFTTVDNGVVFSHFDHGNARALSRLSDNDVPLRLGGRDSVRASLEPVPASYRRIEPLRSIFGLTYVSSWNDSLAIVFAGDSSVVVRDRTGRGTEFILPARDRTGHPVGFREKWRGGRSVSFPDMISAISSQSGVQRLTNGDIAVVHLDIRMANRKMGATTYVSILRPATAKACVDARVPINTEERPRFAFRGDTLLVFAQELAEKQVVSSVRRFVIDVGACGWMAVQTVKRGAGA